MLDIGWSELLVVAVVAVIVVGPKDLPKLMRSIGFYAGKVRRTAADFRRQFDEAMAQSEAQEVRKNIESIRSTMGSVDLKAPIDQPVMMPQGPQAQTPQSPQSEEPRPAPQPQPASAAAEPASPEATPKPKVADKPKPTAPKRRKTKTGANTKAKTENEAETKTKVKAGPKP